MGWSELILVGIVALIVVGPKDFPVMFNAMGKVFAKIKRIGQEFSDALHDAAETSGAEDISDELQSLNDPQFFGADSLKNAAEKFDQWEPGISRKTIGSETAKLAQKRAKMAQKNRKKAADILEKKNADISENIPKNKVKKRTSYKKASSNSSSQRTTSSQRTGSTKKKSSTTHKTKTLSNATQKKQSSSDKTSSASTSKKTKSQQQSDKSA